MLILFILELLIVTFSLFKGSISYFGICFAVFLFAGFLLAKKELKAAGIIGVIVGALMMLTLPNGDFIDFLLGVFIVIHSTRYLKSYKYK